MVARRLSREFNLLAASCRWPASRERDAEIRRLTAEELRWNAFIDLVKRHRVEGLVHRAFTEAQAECPIEVARFLAVRAEAIVTQSLIQAAAAMRLKESLAERNLDFLFLKGATLGILAYETLSVKQAWDIDLLVAPDQAVQAAAVLQEAGYNRTHPTAELSESQFADWMFYCKESLWTRSDGTVVELHTALVDNPRLLAGISARSPSQEVSVGPGTLPTLRRNELFAYLCVHGATHGWARLKWLADVAALLRKQPAGEIETMYRHAQQLGSGRSAAQALLLCARLLALDLPSRLRGELARDGRTQWLVNLALGAMVGHGATELDDTVFGTVGINASHLFLARGLGFKMSELGRKLSNAEDRLIVRLPKPLTFLYPVIAVPLWVWRRYRMTRA